MALTDAQKTSFVYKKAVAQVAETALPRDFFNAYGPTETSVCATVEKCHWFILLVLRQLPAWVVS